MSARRRWMLGTDVPRYRLVAQRATNGPGSRRPRALLVLAPRLRTGCRQKHLNVCSVQPSDTRIQEIRCLAHASTSPVSLTPTEERGNSKSVRTAGAAHAAMAALSLYPPLPPLCASCCASCSRARWRELVVGVFLLVRALLGGGGGGEPRLLRRRPRNWAVSIPVMGVSARVLSCWRTGAGQDASGACRRIRDELVSGVAGGGHVGTVCRSIEDHRSEVVEGECSCVCAGDRWGEWVVGRLSCAAALLYAGVWLSHMASLLSLTHEWRIVRRQSVRRLRSQERVDNDCGLVSMYLRRTKRNGVQTCDGVHHLDRVSSYHERCRSRLKNGIPSLNLDGSSPHSCPVCCAYGPADELSEWFTYTTCHFCERISAKHMTRRARLWTMHEIHRLYV